MRGVLLLQQEQFAAARDAFRRAARNGGDARKCALGLGMAALGAGATEDAWQTFADLVRERPDDAEALHWLLRAGCLLERWQGLRPFLAESVARAPQDASLRFALAGIQVRLGDLEAARGEYQTLCATAPALDGLDSLASRARAAPRRGLRRRGALRIPQRLAGAARAPGARRQRVKRTPGCARPALEPSPAV